MWEYADLEITVGGPLSGTSAEVWYFKTDGNHVLERGKYAELCARLGAAGWEAVAGSARTGSGLSGNHKMNYLFKRSIG